MLILCQPPILHLDWGTQVINQSRTWLGALCDLDLQLVCIDHELGGHAEAAGRDLLDARGCNVAALQALEVRECG